MDRRRYSTILVLAVAALFAEACSSSGGGGTGGAGGGSSSTGGATGTGGKGTGGGTAGATGTGGGTAGATGTGGKTDSGTDTTTGTGGKTDSGTDTPSDTPVVTDASVDADPAATEKTMCTTQAMYQSNITTTPFTAAQFCTLYFSICNDLGGVTHFATQNDCMTAYNGYNMTPDADTSPTGQQGCRTYHLCNAVRLSLNPHCAHATGLTGFDGGIGLPCP